MSGERYDIIGQGYALARRADPRIASAIVSALGDARTVLNVGAGTGSYEPADRIVLAVEPSATMIRQRRADASPCVRASAESLPLPDNSYDAAMAVLTIHHWTDWRQGLREMRRVARRVVLLTFDAEASRFWLTDDYFPQLAALDRVIMPKLSDLEEELGGPSLDEAAESVGSRGLPKFWDITFPLTTPGYVSGALLVLIWTFADFATPLVVGIDNLLASQAYLNIVQFVDRRLFKMGIVISAIMVILAIIFLIIAKQYVAIKDYSSLSYSKIERKKMSPWGRVGVVVFLILVLIFAFIPYIGIGLDSFGRGWALTPIPVKYTLQYFERVAIETPKFIINSLLYSGISVFICIIVGVPVAWVMARTKVPGRDLLDSLSTLILALPGTGIGIAYMRAFKDPLPFMNTALLGMWIVIPIVLGVRRLPYTVRGTFASLLIVHKSFEEAVRV